MGERAAAADGLKTVPLGHFCGTCPMLSLIRRLKGASGGRGSGVCSISAPVREEYAGNTMINTLATEHNNLNML
jgi:hypothetical protein